MIARRTLGLLCLSLAWALLLVPAGASAAEPKFSIESAADSTVAPGSQLTYYVQIYNEGDADTAGQIEVLAQLPAGLIAVNAALRENSAAIGSCADAADGVSSVAGAGSVLCTDAVVATTRRSSIIHNRQTLILTVEATSGSSGTVTAAFSVSGGGAGAPARAVAPTRISPAAPPFGIDAIDTGVLDANGAASTQAAGHPAVDITAFALNTIRDPRPVYGDLRPPAAPHEAVSQLPAGLLGNPSGLERCTLGELAKINVFDPRPLCPVGSQVGTATVQSLGSLGGIGNSGRYREPLFNLDPPPGSPARFGFNVVGTVVVLDAHLRAADNYAVSVGATKIPEGLAFFANTLEFWGDPSDPAHDFERACPGEMGPSFGGPIATDPECEEGHGYDRPEHLAFLRNPTACTAPGEGLETTFRVDSWDNPGVFDERTVTSHEAPGYPLPDEPSTFPAGYTGPTQWGQTVGIEGCEAVPFEPSFSATPTTNAADSPTGLTVHLHMPQNGLEDSAAISESDLRGAVVTLPEGMSVNPAAANGQGACTPAQIGLATATGATPVRFDEAEPSCPDDSKIGTATLTTPLLDHQLHGAVYLASQGQNPFGSLLAMYLVIDDPQSGVLLKLPGEIEADPQSGRLTTSFADNPQLPFSDLDLELFGGSRAALKTPAACGTYATEATLTGWAGKTVGQSSSFQISQGCGGGFDPKLSAGTEQPLAGRFSPFSVRLTREDGMQELGGLHVTLPPGLIGSLKGISYCPDAALAAVSGELGTGGGQIASPSCPASSQVGTVTVGAGAGANPFYTGSGRAYLAGPYKGAPVSLAVIAPAVAGPFDLGSVVVRNALRVDPTTAQITAVSDPLPSILHGIPLDLRDVRVELNRDHFILNPTSCEPMQIGSQISSTGGAGASPSVHFQVAGCDQLRFKPALTLKLRGGTKRTKNPGVTAVMRPRLGDANARTISVALPHSEFLDQSHIRTICTRVQFAADACPAGSVYGSVTATTPILDQPLSGLVYLRSSDHPLPDMVLKLVGPPSLPIEIDAAGRIDTDKAGGIRTTFEGLPDAPLTEVVLKLPAGKKSLLENSTDICARKQKATVTMKGQNNAVNDFRPVLKVKCPKRKGGKHRHKR